MAVSTRKWPRIQNAQITVTRCSFIGGQHVKLRVDEERHHRINRFPQKQCENGGINLKEAPSLFTCFKSMTSPNFQWTPMMIFCGRSATRVK